jgi:hypothetical protein
MTAESRARLGARQAELIRALYGGAPAKDVDARAVSITVASLARKRARAVAAAWPALARGMGGEFAGRFGAYARATPPPDGGALGDGLAFSHILARERHLPDGALVERMLATTRVKLRGNRLAARRSPRLAAAITGRPRRLVIVISIPPIGVRLVALGPFTRVACLLAAAAARKRIPQQDTVCRRGPAPPGSACRRSDGPEGLGG